MKSEGIFVIASDVTEQVLTRNQVDALREMLGHELRNITWRFWTLGR